MSSICHLWRASLPFKWTKRPICLLVGAYKIKLNVFIPAYKLIMILLSVLAILLSGQFGRIFLFFFSYYLNIFYWLKESEPSYLKAIVRFYPITSPLPDRKKREKVTVKISWNKKKEEMYKDTCTGKHCIDMCAWNVTRIKSLYCFHSKTLL